MSSIQQGTRDFALYYAEFQRYSAEVKWDEVAKLATLKKGLAYCLKNDLVMAAIDPVTVAELVTLCNRLDTRRRALQGESSGRIPASSGAGASSAPTSA